MFRPLVPLALALLLAPATLAHVPPTPQLQCQTADGARYHDYGPAGDGALRRPLVIDGSIGACNVSTLDVGLGACLGLLAGTPVVCDPYDIGVRPLLGYDGDREYGAGVAVLAYGANAWPCWGLVPHHSGDIYAVGVLGSGPRISVYADGAANGAPCGDGYVLPCDLHPPPPNNGAFPVNVVVDAVGGMHDTLFGPGGPGCDVFDDAQRFDSRIGGPSGGALAISPGADGVLVVVIEAEAGGVPHAGGHVWTA